MFLKGVALVLEGGGARCAYTAGILDYFVEKNLQFPYVVGVSAGAITGANYIGGQYRRFLSRIMDQKDAAGKEEGYVGGRLDMNRVLTKANETLTPFDFENYMDMPIAFDIGVMDAETGEGLYFDGKSVRSSQELIRIVAASSALPGIASAVRLYGKEYFDGGYTEAIPLYQSIHRGYQKAVVILTRQRSYQKPAELLSEEKQQGLKRYPHVIRRIEGRHVDYNRTKVFLDYMESKGDVVVLAPEDPVIHSALDFDTQRMLRLYRAGYEAGKDAYIEIRKLEVQRNGWYD